MESEIRSVEVQCNLETEKALDDSDLIGELVVRLKEVFPETENLRPAYVFSNCELKMYMIMQQHSFSVCIRNSEHMSKLLLVLSEVLQAVRQECIPDLDLESTIPTLRVNLETSFKQEHSLDGISNFDVFLDRILPPHYSGVSLRHLGLVYSDNDCGFSLGIAPREEEDGTIAVTGRASFMVGDIGLSCIETEVSRGIEIVKSKGKEIVSHILDRALE